MSTVCGRPQGGEGGSGPCGRMWTGGGVKNGIFCGRHKWMAPCQHKIHISQRAQQPT